MIVRTSFCSVDNFTFSFRTYRTRGTRKGHPGQHIAGLVLGRILIGFLEGNLPLLLFIFRAAVLGLMQPQHGVRELLELLDREGALLCTFLGGLGTFGFFLPFVLASRAEPAFTSMDFVAMLAWFPFALIALLGLVTLPFRVAFAVRALIERAKVLDDFKALQVLNEFLEVHVVGVRVGLHHLLGPGRLLGKIKNVADLVVRKHRRILVHDFGPVDSPDEWEVREELVHLLEPRIKFVDGRCTTYIKVVLHVELLAPH